MLRNAALIALAGAGDSDIGHDGLAEVEQATAPTPSRQDLEERRALIAALAAE